MAGQDTLSQTHKSVAGSALIALGVLILCANLTSAAAQLTHTIGVNLADAQSLGLLAVFVLGASHTLRVYLFSQQEIVRGFHQVLLSLWPLLFVVAGTALLRDEFAEDAEKRKNKPPNMPISQPVVRR